MSSGISPRKKLKKSDLFEDTEQERYKIERLIDDVQNCQDRLDELSEKKEIDKSQVEEKYRDLKELVYEKRDANAQKIPEFWITCFKNHPRLRSLVDQRNSEWLKYMTKFRVEDGDQSKIAFKISLFFEDNPFFENKVLSKEFVLDEDGEYVSTSSAIKWKQGVGRRNKENSMGRKRKLEEDSFLEWFQNNRDPSPELPGILYFLWLKPVPFFLGPQGQDFDADGLSLLLDGDDDDESSDED